MPDIALSRLKVSGAQSVVTYPHRLAGVTQEPNETPSPRRRVVVIDQVNLNYVASVLSDPDGSFEIRHLADRTFNPNPLAVIVFDDDGAAPHHKGEILTGVVQVT